MLAGLRSVVGGVRATLGVRSGSSLVVKEPFRVQSRIVGSRRNVQTDSNGAIATSTGLETPLVATPAPATSPTAKSATSDSIYSISPPELVAILSAMRHPATSTLPRLSNPVYEGKVRGLSFESDYQYHLRLCGHQEISGVAREVTLAWEVANGIDGAATPSLIDGKSSREFLYEVTRWFPYVGDSGIGGILPPQAFKAYIGALHLESGREGTRKLLAPYFHLRLQNLCNLPPSSPHTFPSVTSTSPATPTLTPTSTPTPTPTSMPTPTATPTPTPSTASVPAATATVVILAPFIANPAQSVHLSAPNFVPAVTSTPVTPFHSFSPATPTILEEIRSAMYRPAATEMRLDDDDLGAVVFGATKPRSTRPYSPERLRWVGASEMRGIAVEVCVVLQPSNSTARLLEEAVESITTGALAVGIASRFRWPRGGSASLGELQSFVGATFWQEGRHGTRNLLAPFFYEALMARLDSLPSIASATDELSVSALLPIYSSPSPTSAELLQPTGTAALPPSAESQPSAQKSSTAKSSSVAKPVLKVPTPPKFAPVALPTSSPSSTNTESPPAVDHEPISAQKCDSPSSPAPVLPVAVPSTPSSTPATPPTPVTTAEVQSIPVSTSNSTPPSKSTISASTPSQISTPAPLPTTPKKPIASARVKAAPISTTKSTPSKSTPSKASIKSAAKPSKISVPVVKTAVIPPAKSSTVKSSTIKTSAAKTTAKSTPPSPKSSIPSPVPTVF